jgi:hypothetical protein
MSVHYILPLNRIMEPHFEDERLGFGGDAVVRHNLSRAQPELWPVANVSKADNKEEQRAQMSGKPQCCRSVSCSRPQFAGCKCEGESQRARHDNGTGRSHGGGCRLDNRGLICCLRRRGGFDRRRRTRHTRCNRRLGRCRSRRPRHARIVASSSQRVCDLLLEVIASVGAVGSPCPPCTTHRLLWRRIPSSQQRLQHSLDSRRSSRLGRSDR